MFLFGVADDRGTQLEGAVQEGEKFKASLADMLSWIADKQEAVKAAEPVSGHKDLVMQQSMDHDTLTSEVTAKEPDLRLILDKGQKMMDSASPMSDISDLSEKLEGLKQEHKGLKDKLAERANKLKEANRLANKFQGDADLMKAWLELNEEKLDSAAPIDIDEDIVNKQLKEAQVSALFHCYI